MDMYLEARISMEPVKFHTKEPVKLIFIGHCVMVIYEGSELVFNGIGDAKETKSIQRDQDTKGGGLGVRCLGTHRDGWDYSEGQLT